MIDSRICKSIASCRFGAEDMLGGIGEGQREGQGGHGSKIMPDFPAGDGSDESSNSNAVSQPTRDAG